jgi:hypothetical protein
VQEVGQCRTAIDLGANIGLAALYFSSHYPECELLAVEPHRGTYEMLDILKVDIEGAEVELFKGDVGWLSRVRAIAIEFHDDSREVSGFDRLMRDHGFRVLDSNPHTVLALKA